MKSDVWNFEQLAERYEAELDGQRKAKLCEDACELYRGEFLPFLSSEEWVIQKGRSYQKLYSRMLKYLLQYLKKIGDYRKMEAFAARGAELCPFEEWEVWLIDSLNALGRHREAADVYREVVERMQDMGGFLSKKQQEHFRQVGDRIMQPEGMGEDISKCLMEYVPGEGAYACTLPGFLDCFSMLKRTSGREKIHFCLLLCTILDANGCPANGGKHNQEEKLCASFGAYLRKGDIYAKYSENQYLLMCVGVKREDIYEIGARIDRDFRKRCGGRGGINYTLLDDGTTL